MEEINWNETHDNELLEAKKIDLSVYIAFSFTMLVAILGIGALVFTTSVFSVVFM